MSIDDKDLKDYQKALLENYGPGTASIYKDLLKNLDTQINNQFFSPANQNTIFTSSVTTPPWKISSVVKKYPISNQIWWIVEDGSAMKDSLLEHAILKSETARRYFKEIKLSDGEVFCAKLEDVRPKVGSSKTKTLPELHTGHTYDPWWRDISVHRSEHYVQTFTVGFDRASHFQISVGPNSEKLLIVWNFRSTIEKNPIHLVLYTFANFKYVDKRKKNAHLNTIHPYNCSTADNYDIE